MKKTDAQLLSVILSDIDRLILLTKDLSYSDFASSFTLSDCCCFRLIQISENVRRLSPEFFFEHPGVPLRAIIGFGTGPSTITATSIFRSFIGPSKKSSPA